MGGKAGGKTRVADYYLSMHLGICTAGEGLELLEVRVGERSIWKGVWGSDSQRRATVRRHDLFGGNLKEGGVSGIMHWLPGGPMQVLTTGLAKRLGLARRDAPAYRNIASIWFTGARAFDAPVAANGWDDWIPNQAGGSRLGWMWCSNNPYLRPVWARVRRPSIGLNPAKAMLPADPAKPDGPKVSNPAHMIYECLTNRDWGAGASPAGIDRASFEHAADVLWTEGLGLTAKWMRQSTIESFVNEVLDHIAATLFLHPRTGKQTLKLLRADYDVATLRRITPQNARITNLQRKLWGETSNEIVVTWTNPANEGEETVTAQDLANIALQGGTVSSSRNFHMLRSARIAQQIAQREVEAAGQPLIACNIEMNRTGWDVVPGEVVVLEGWTDIGVGQVLLRVAEVNSGTPGSATMSFSAMEDIYGVPLSEFYEPEPPPDPDTDLPLPVATYHLMTAPAMLAASAAGLSDPEGLEYPDATVVVLAAPRPDDVSLSLWSDITLPSGTVTVGQIAILDMAGTARLFDPLMPRPTSVLPAIYDAVRFDLEDGDFVLIGSGDDDDTELAVVTSVTETTITLNRGTLDTVPRAWPSGTRLWRIGSRQTLYDPIQRAAGDAVTYRLLPQTSRGGLLYEDAPDVTITPGERAMLPLRPADVRVRGRQYSPVGTESDTSITVSWAHRNRLLEASVALPWTAASNGRETGQTTKVTVLSEAGTVLATYSGLTGTSQVVPVSVFGAATKVRIRVSSHRDGFDSLQAYEIEVYPGATFSYGYGGSYGESYGG